MFIPRSRWTSLDSALKSALLAAVLLASVLFSSAGAYAGPLTLAEAERIAIERDALRESLLEESAAMRESAHASSALPDPELRFGVMNLPVDTFAFDQEPMTQLQVGFRQAFPAGDTLDLREQHGELQARSTVLEVGNRDRQLRLMVRQLWLQRQAAGQAAQRVGEVADDVRPVLAARESRYATGGGQQADYLAARLKLDRLAERELAFREMQRSVTERLGRLLGDAAYREPVDAGMALPDTGPDKLDQHPLLQAQDARISAGETAVELAREKFSPSWMLDVSYGDRRGVDALGRDRPDFASAMVAVSIPLFNRGAKRQEVGAAESRKRAATWQRVDMLRQFQSRWHDVTVSLEEIDRQLTLQDEQLLPTARQTVDSTSRAYANDLVSLDRLVEAHMDLLDIELRRIELVKRRDMLRAELDYLGGSEQ